MSGSSRNTAQATRRRLLNSFNSLVLNGAEGRITVAEIVREAGVGRSTFYDHYASAQDIHEQALATPLTVLAESILGLQSNQQLSQLLDHFWEHRARARNTLFGEEGEKVEALLVALLEARLPKAATGEQNRIAAIELAVVPLSLIRAWLSRTVRCDSAEMASHIAKASAAMRRELLHRDF